MVRKLVILGQTRGPMTSENTWWLGALIVRVSWDDVETKL